MTLTILVSFSLLALVATARPAFPDTVQEPSKRDVDVQNAVQAIFQSRVGRLPKEDEEDVHIHITSSEEQHAYLSNLDELDEVRAVLPLGDNGVFSEDEKKLYNIISEASGHLDDLDGGFRMPEDMTPRTRHALLPVVSEVEPLENDQAEALSYSSSLKEFALTPSVLVLAVACIAALLMTFCVGAALYLTRCLRSSLLSSQEVWILLPRLEKVEAIDDSSSTINGLQGGTQDAEKAIDSTSSSAAKQAEKVIDKKGQQEAPDLILFDDDELEEKFHDAEDHPDFFEETKTLQRHIDLPRVVVDFADPSFLPLPRSESPFYTPPHTPIHTPPRSPVKSPLQMRAVRPVSPASIPAWSLRAADSPSFAVPESNSSLRIPGALFPDSLTAPESPDQRVSWRQTSASPRSQIDIALALQLRPGLGLGADPAWLVRFLMAMFGWMTVLLGGSGLPN